MIRRSTANSSASLVSARVLAFPAISGRRRHHYRIRGDGLTDLWVKFYSCIIDEKRVKWNLLRYIRGKL